MSIIQYLRECNNVRLWFLLFLFHFSIVVWLSYSALSGGELETPQLVVSSVFGILSALYVTYRVGFCWWWCIRPGKGFYVRPDAEYDELETWLRETCGRFGYFYHNSRWYFFRTKHTIAFRLTWS